MVLCGHVDNGLFSGDAATTRSIRGDRFVTDLTRVIQIVMGWVRLGRSCSTAKVAQEVKNHSGHDVWNS